MGRCFCVGKNNTHLLITSILMRRLHQNPSPTFPCAEKLLGLSSQYRGASPPSSAVQEYLYSFSCRLHEIGMLKSGMWQYRRAGTSYSIEQVGSIPSTGLEQGHLVVSIYAYLPPMAATARGKQRGRREANRACYCQVKMDSQARSRYS